MLHSCYGVNAEGHLTLGGLDTVELVKEYGTPLYLLDTDHVRAMCRMYKKSFAAAFGSASAPVYAGKALCCTRIYRIMAEEGLYADCVSPGEILTARHAGFPMSDVFFHGNNKTDEDLRTALSLGVGHIVVDSMDELDALEDLAAAMNVTAKILLRITPGIDPHTHRKIITGNVDSKFGSAIVTGAAEAILCAAMRKPHLVLDGLHCHIGSQIFEIEPFADAADIMTGFIARMRQTHGYEGTILNLGGGFGVRYTEDDPTIDYPSYVSTLGKELDQRCERYRIERPTILMEPGRSLVAAAGVTLYTVGSVKEIPGFRNYVSIDGGMPDNPRYALYQSRYTVLHAERADAAPDFPCTVAGRCCESGDLIAENVSVVRPRRGDILAVLVTGAYNYSMASHYNRIPKPPVIEISEGKATVAVRRERWEDLYALDEVPPDTASEEVSP